MSLHPAGDLAWTWLSNLEHKRLSGSLWRMTVEITGDSKQGIALRSCFLTSNNIKVWAESHTLLFLGRKGSLEYLLLEDMDDAKLQCYQGPSMPGTKLIPLSPDELSELPAWLTTVISFGYKIAGTISSCVHALSICVATADTEVPCMCLQARHHLVHMPPDYDPKSAMLVEAVWDKAAASPFILDACGTTEAQSQAIHQDVADSIDWDKVELFSRFLGGS